jgi:hypothetical protein
MRAFWTVVGGKTIMAMISLMYPNLVILTAQQLADEARAARNAC